jgi:hypothetical protein
MSSAIGSGGGRVVLFINLKSFNFEEDVKRFGSLLGIV